MLSTRPGATTKPAVEVDTSVGNLGYIGFQPHEDTRSPRSPVYMPDPSSLTFLPPFDPTRALHSSDHPFATNQVTTTTNSHLKATLPPLPEEPLTWVWICHLCHSRYPLGVTRRCLVDGHYYCSGEAAQPNLRKKKKKQSCSSEFDYVTWRAWGAWKRKARKILKNPRPLKGCEKCAFPSQCRYPAEAQVEVDQDETSETDDKTGSDRVQSDGDGDHIMTDSDCNGDSETLSVSTTSSSSTANQDINFDQILSGILDSNDASMASDSCSETWLPAKPSKKGKKNVVSGTEDEKTRESNRLKQLIGPDLWDNLEDIDLETTRME